MNGARRLAAAALLMLVVSGCGGPSGTTDTVSAPASGFEPVTITDCSGRETRFTEPPRRVVAMSNPAIEMLAWLGLTDRLVGVGSAPKAGALPAEFEARVQAVPALTGEYVPGTQHRVPREQLLAAAPDYVLGAFTSNFSPGQPGTQDDLAASGIKSYLMVSNACPAATGPRDGFELIYRDLRNLGETFGARDRADQLIASMQKTMTAATRSVGKPQVSVFPYEVDEATSSPVAPGRGQAVSAVIAAAGGRTIFGDLDAPYSRVSWEQIAARDPEVILLIIYDRGSPVSNDEAFARAEHTARANPALAQTRAGRDGRFARALYEQASTGSVRNAHAVTQLVPQLHPGAGI
ncbi:ABC transporter substrate-binding protein [Saccharothrix sp. AJ9571]|nr:ABC transporter substrate-binding protein [Saccharothrix sp. AJ9571]